MVDGAASEWIPIISGAPQEGCWVGWVLIYLFYKPAKCMSWLRADYFPMQMTPHYWQLFASQQTDLLLLDVAASLNRDLARIQEWCNHCCMILNPNKTKSLVISRSRTVGPLHGDLVLSGFISELVPTSTSLARSSAASSPSKTMCVVLFSVSVRKLVFEVG